MADNLLATTETTGTVSVGGSARGEIETGGDRDWFAVDLVAGRTYRIDLDRNGTGNGALWNPYLRGIHDADGVRIARTGNDNGGVGYNSRVYFTAEETATFYVAAGAYGNQTGTYTLSVTEFTDDDFAADTGTAGRVAVGGSVTGEIDYATDVDWFEVDLSSGSYRIDLEGASSGDGTLRDPYLRGIYDEDGGLVADTTNDDGGADLNSRVWFPQASDATYYVAVGAAGPRQGTYKLSVVDVTTGAPDDFAADTGTTGEVTVGGSVTGEIEDNGIYDSMTDRDWFAVELVAGKTYRIDLEGSSSGDGTLRDPYLRGIHDAGGVLIDGTPTNNGGDGYNSRLYFTAEETGTYYVAAGVAIAHLGTYTLSVAEMTQAADDYAANTGTTGRVTVGGSTTGEIEVNGDRDWFAVELAADRDYKIDLKGWSTGAGTLFDPYLRGIHDAAGNLIAGTTDDHDGRGYNSRVYFTTEEAGTYYVAAGADGTYEGTYRLTVKDITDDFGATKWTSGRVAVGSPARGRIEVNGDRDWFAVELDAGRFYRIDLEGSLNRAGVLSDPYLRGIHDSNGAHIRGTTDDDGGVGYNSRVEFLAPSSGTYYVAAGAARSGKGTYKLTVTDFTDDFAADTGTTGRVTVGGSKRGDIEKGGDRDWFAVELDAGGFYRIDLEGSRTSAGTLSDPYLRGVYKANGARIPGIRDDDGGVGNNSRVWFTANDAGTYYVAAGAWGDETGTYTLLVEEVL